MVLPAFVSPYGGNIHSHVIKASKTTGPLRGPPYARCARYRAPRGTTADRRAHARAMTAPMVIRAARGGLE